MFVEIVGGVMAGSVAILTDAAHMLADVGGSLRCFRPALLYLTMLYLFRRASCGGFCPRDGEPGGK
jgi:hypothetical protein